MEKYLIQIKTSGNGDDVTVNKITDIVKRNYSQEIEYIVISNVKYVGDELRKEKGTLIQFEYSSTTSQKSLRNCIELDLSGILCDVRVLDLGE